MNRRNFIGLVGRAAIAASVLPHVPSLIIETAPEVSATLESYADFVSFHEIALATAIDPTWLEDIQREMAWRVACSIDALMVSSGGRIDTG